MLLGTHAPKLDEKSRLILPAKFREEFASGLYLTQGQERCIYVFSDREFRNILSKIESSGASGRENRENLRTFMSSVSDQMPDRQGRVTIPASLREFAGLGRELIVIGVGSRAEIWDAKSWADRLPGQQENFASIAEEVIPGVL